MKRLLNLVVKEERRAFPRAVKVIKEEQENRAAVATADHEYVPRPNSEDNNVVEIAEEYS